MTLDEALIILKQSAEEGAAGLQQLEANREAARRAIGPSFDQQMEHSKRSLEAVRVVVAWVEEKRLTG